MRERQEPPGDACRPRSRKRLATRRAFLGQAAAAVAAPPVVSSKVFGAGDRIVMGFIGVGGQGRGDMGGALGHGQVRGVAVCDVVRKHREMAKGMVDRRYGNSDYRACTDFREITSRGDIDAVLIATPDHWHAIIAVEAMVHGVTDKIHQTHDHTVEFGTSPAPANAWNG